ncbi:protein-disulfide reductase DsbD [Sphingomonas sp. SUN039]|uniref:protein-disulfide reductase DsbD family protein n=1 Tax=Sphingomonas sp. SUN039 TaxID=2937787 RepID=UPI0021643BA4|nr:thioredoxin family protein [Sphingomonas sp. SUN039]UVO54869.1 thioredoxin family protein [Sphingomonas sp. SUN039]
MTARRFSLVTLVLAVTALFGVVPLRAEPNHIVATLVAESATPAPGKTVMLAVAMQPEPGWHGYWSNPGEAGFEPRFDWNLPKGATTGSVSFPVPQPLVVGGLMNYVFEGPHALLVPLTLPEGLAAGTKLPVALKLDYLACTDQICVPQRAELSTVLTVGDGTPDARVRFDGWRTKLPTPLGATVRFERAGKLLRFAIPFPAGAALVEPHFFPAANGLIVDAAPQKFGRDGDLLVAELATTGDESKPVSGVLSTGEGRGLTIAASPGTVPPLPASETGWSAILLALGGAVLGGLILNIMPCVFPILSLKALSLAKAGGDERSARRDALGYTLGAVLVCVALGGAILALRAAGSSVGWAFQLQDPRVIVALLVLVTAIALNFAGLFELPTVGGGLASTNSVATGALAAFIATPCTGPFMGAALGAALVLPTAAALAVFAGLGLGLALPFLLLGFIPALRRALPKPGAWMATMRRILSVPMFLTALGLVWLLGRQAGSDAVTVGLLGALAAALAFWWAGLRQAKGKGGLAFAALAAVVASGLAIAWLPAATPAGAAAPTALNAEPFSETRLAALRAKGRPVFVYFTADWCLTCKVNERVAIEQPSVEAAFKTSNVAVLVGDWTRSDPAIGRFLEAQGRSGVPLYLFYPKGGEAQTLPQVLTPGTLTALVTSP